MADGVHQPLEGLGSILETERHSKSKRGDNGGFQDVFSRNGDLVIAADEVYFGKHAHAREMGRKIVYVWYWIPVGSDSVIEAPVSPHGRQPPEAFGTMCSGEAQGLDDRRTMPMASILSNSALARASFSGGKRQARAWMGEPLVVMKCSTWCLVGDCTKFGVVMPGNSTRSESYWSEEMEIASRWGAGNLVGLSGTEW